MKQILFIMLLFAVPLICLGQTPSLLQNRSVSPMAPPGGGSVSTAGDRNVPFANGTQAGNAIVCGMTWSGTSTTVSFNDDKSNTWVVDATGVDSTNGQTVGIAHALNVASGTKIPKWHNGTGSPTNFVTGNCMEFNNVATSSAVDGTPVCHVATGTSVTSGSITTTVDGDLVVEVVFNTQNGKVTTWTVGSAPWLFANANSSNNVNLEGWASQWQVQTTHGAINPTMTQDSSTTYSACGLALKKASAGAGRPAGIYVTSLQSINTQDETAASVKFQMPTHDGNLIVIAFAAGPGYTISSCTDSSSNTYTVVGTVLNNTEAQIVYAKNITTNEALAITCTMSGSDVGGNGATFLVHEIKGADTSAPLDTSFGTSGFASATGTQATGGAGGDVTSFTATPGGQNEVIIVSGGIAFDTATAWTTPSGAAFTGATFTGITNPSNSDENNVWGVFYNGASTASETWTFQHDTSNFAGVGQWAVAGSAFKAPAAAGGGIFLNKKQKLEKLEW